LIDNSAKRKVVDSLLLLVLLFCCCGGHGAVEEAAASLNRPAIFGRLASVSRGPFTKHARFYSVLLGFARFPSVCLVPYRACPVLLGKKVGNFFDGRGPLLPAQVDCGNPAAPAWLTALLHPTDVYNQAFALTSTTLSGSKATAYALTPLMMDSSKHCFSWDTL
jgi:hypothetical protein